MKSDYEIKRDRLINKVKKAVRELEITYGLKPYVDKDRETMIGSAVDNVYVRMVGYSGRTIEQKHLFTARA